MAKVAAWTRGYADAATALCVMGGVFTLTRFFPTVLEGGITVLGAEITIGIGVMGVVLASMAILVALMGNEYLIVIRATRGGMKRALRPYTVVALAGGVGGLVALLATVAYPAMPGIGRCLCLSLSTSISSYALVGLVQLVAITAGHGAMRAQLLERMSGWEAAVREAREAEPHESNH
ncbi:MAG: hypothetical protein JF887_03345 [Candidatus Dormibacteraeota bacterium]|uniref:Uncharacterized protein n=1 Tax=Candidatus Amunia macphersoniae TaxID=3127014 RepID=A0A934NE71_9BACT|nr:hypothetical protein [Candidatus Dormibacteraeota bacterium]